jgi:ssDNA-binding replication factor A large subunit
MHPPSKHIGKWDVIISQDRVITMSTEFKKMIETVLQEKPEINAEMVKDMIEEKKKTIGAGYLTDQGALFLVAADLGISFENAPKIDSGIKDLYVGAKEIGVIGRVINIYPTRKFMKKETQEEIRNRTLTIYDNDSAVKIKLWDSLTDFPEERGLKPGDLIKISRGYVKASLNGSPLVNLGSNSSIEIIHGSNTAIQDINSITISVDEISHPRENTVIVGKVNSNPRISEFTNARGERSKSLQLHLSNQDQSKSVRVVIWNVDEVRLPKVLENGVQLKLIGVRIKQGNPQYGNSDFEIHGDEGTAMELSGNQLEVEVMPLRIISVGRETTRGTISCLAVNRSHKYFTLNIDSSVVPSEIHQDTVIECIPSRILGDSIILSADDSYIRIVDDDSSFPRASMLESKIKDINSSKDPLLIEAIVLQAPNETEVNTKNAGVVTLTDTIIGDDTGEIRLVGWREQSSEVRKLNVGDRIKVAGATVNSRIGGRQELTLRQYSSIIQMR